MNHWFGDPTKDIAPGSASRSTIRGSLLKAGAAAISPSLFARSGNLCQTEFAHGAGERRASTCNIRWEGRTLIFNLTSTTTFKGQSVSFELISRTARSRRSSVFKETHKSWECHFARD